MKFANVFKSVSDERLVIDIVAPGFNKDMVTVKTALLNNGEIFKVVVEGIYKPHTNKDGKEVPALGFEKFVEDFKYAFVDADADAYDIEKLGDDRLFKSHTFFSADYELDKLKWSVTDGVIRVSIPKTAKAIGKAVDAVDNADADSSGVAD